MTRRDLTHITFVLDRSGSMTAIKAATIESFNAFLNSQKALPGCATMTLVQFDYAYELLASMQPLEAIPELDIETFVPRGSTALLDAMGRAIAETGEALSRLPEADRPGIVIFVTLTDGEENSSLQFDMATINQQISHQRSVYQWQFVFLAANQDAIATAANLGIGASQALRFASDPEKVAATFDIMNAQMQKVRAAKMADDDEADPLLSEIEFTDAMRILADDE